MFLHEVWSHSHDFGCGYELSRRWRSPPWPNAITAHYMLTLLAGHSIRLNSLLLYQAIMTTLSRVVWARDMYLHGLSF